MAETPAERLKNEMREIDALVESTRGEVARLQAKEDAATSAMAAFRARPDPSAADVLTASDELAMVLRRKGAMTAELETLQAKRKFLDRLEAQIQSSPVDAAPTAPVAVAAPPAEVDESRVLRAVVQAQEEERRRIARAVHDGPAQAMANVVLQSEISERVFALDAIRARTELAALRTMVNRTLQELRGFIFDLRPMTLDDLGLVPTLRRYIQTLVDKHGVTIEFSSVGRDQRLASDDEVAVFRLVQDALLERLQKAHAKELAVALDWHDDLVIVEVQSDGKTLASSGDFASGLSRNERVELLGAEATQETHDGRAVLRVRVPVVPRS